LKNILVVEDSKAFARAVKIKIEKESGYRCIVTHTFAEAKAVLDEGCHDFFIAVLDLVLPDAQNGEIVDQVTNLKIPVVVLTGGLNDDIRERILSKNVADYILKEGPHSLDYLIGVIRRVDKNQNTNVLVVDDSAVSRKMICRLMKIQHFNVFEAQNGKEALDLLAQHPDIKLVVTDYSMPKMDGFELTSEIRKKYPVDTLAVIGISAHGNSLLSARFLKKGANDFIVKPFGDEEFFCRVNQAIEMLDHIESLKKAASSDYLTGLYNRRYFFDIGETLFKNAKRDNMDITVAMVDIDNFKRINDQYGHQCGDMLLQHISAIIRNHFRSSDVVCRFGGEEFCVLSTNMEETCCQDHFERLRSAVENESITYGGENIFATVSVGVMPTLSDSLEGMIQTADQRLYHAKVKGRNRVIVG
jgi:diguanylate cyclase (GGDEF)-like protein